MKTLGKVADNIDFDSFAKEEKPIWVALSAVRFFYVFLLFSAVSVFSRLGLPDVDYREVSRLWSTGWVNFVSLDFALNLTRILFIFTSLLAAIFPNRKIFRIAVFIGTLEFISVCFAVLKVDVDWYPVVMVAGMFILLPDGWKNVAGRGHQEMKKRFLLVFWGGQLLMLLTYTMAGIGKLRGAYLQIIAGEHNAFSIDALARLIAQRMIVSNSTSIAGPWLVEHPWVGWIFYIGSIYLMLFAIFVAFRPKLHRIWAIGLILFHIASALSMNIAFQAHVFLLGALFLFSPFVMDDFEWKGIARSLPVVGFVIRKVGI